MVYLFRLIGIDMEASNTFLGGLRNYLAALGFILLLIGTEELFRPTRPWWGSIVLLASSYLVYVLACILKQYETTPLIPRKELDDGQ